MNKVLFSSQSDEWATPQWVYDELDAEFNFNLDPCATDENHKCEKYYTIHSDGLKADWGGVLRVCEPSVLSDRRMGSKSA